MISDSGMSRPWGTYRLFCVNFECCVERDGIVEWGRVCAGSRVSYTAFHRSILYAINEVLHSLIQNNKATKVRIGALLLFGDKWRLFCPVYSLPTF